MPIALVTGGTGSFGQTMVRHLLSRGYDEIRVFSRDEEKQDTMRRVMNDRRLKFFIGDVRRRESLLAPMAVSNSTVISSILLTSNHVSELLFLFVNRLYLWLIVRYPLNRVIWVYLNVDV